MLRLARALSLTVAIVGLACGKRPFVPEEAPSSSASPSLVLHGPPALDASALAPFEPHDDDADASDATEPPTPTALSATCNGVSLVITSLTTDQNGVDAVVELRNGSSSHVPLMLPGDGSDSGRRNPTVTFELSPNKPAPTYGCGNMNALSPREIVFLPPSSRTRLSWLTAPTPASPGHYTLRATYRNDPTSDRLGDNMPGPKTDRLLARVRKTVPCTLTSNTLSFTWNGPTQPSVRKP